MFPLASTPFRKFLTALSPLNFYIQALSLRMSRKRGLTRQQNGTGSDEERSSPMCKKTNGTNADETILRVASISHICCRICRERPKNPHATQCCGLIYCNDCLENAVKTRNKCPSCDREFSEKSHSYPTELKETEPPPAKTHLQQDEPVVINNVRMEDMDINQLEHCMNAMQRFMQEKCTRERGEAKRLTELMLEEMMRKLNFEIQTVSRTFNTMRSDIERLRRESHKTSQPEPPISCNSEVSLSSLTLPSDSSLPSLLPSASALDRFYPPGDPLLMRIKNHRDSVMNAYLDMLSSAHLPGEGSDVRCLTPDGRLGALGEMIQGVIKYGEAKRVATLNYDAEPVPQMSIVSSLEFDKNCERFVVAGVTKKIKIFNFDSVINNPDGIHYPLSILKCKSKISNISWNTFNENILCSSDYDGHVTVWDTEEGKIVRTFEEHEKRCWTVHFNSVDPSLIASGSDDSKVKLWNLKCDRSVCTIEAKVNVCCVYFSPKNRNELVFGSADHCVHLYDIRNPAKALNIFKGHRKAVSYVRYLNDKEVVSASTDSTLRVWDIQSGRCMRVLRGHTNEKNFVGLSGYGDHIMCGSENSRVFFYYKGISDPMCNYVVSKDGSEEESEGFVSSVCWKKESDYVLVANSQGRVQVLQLV